MMSAAFAMPIRAAAAATLCLTLALPGAAHSQSMIFDEMPSAERTVSLLRGERNIVSTQSGASVITQGQGFAAAPAAPAAQAPAQQQPQAGTSRPARPAASRPRRPAQPTRVCATPPDGEVEFGVPVQFAINSARLPAKFRAGLGRLAEALAEAPGAVVEIGGHTDVSGGDGVNVPLSQRRAAAVFTALVQDHGADPSMLRVVGFGSTRLCTPDTPRDPVNRRVGFKVLQNAS